MLLFLAACLPTTEPDAARLQLENAEVLIEGCGDVESCEFSFTGALTTTRTADQSAADLAITIGEDSYTVHSPSGADLSAFEGKEVTASIKGDWMLPTSTEIRDDVGLAYAVEAGAGAVFSNIPVAYGEELGSFVDDADYQITFRAIDITTDTGVVSVQPGDVTTIVVDGVSYRFAAIAAYEVDTIPDGEYADCGGEMPFLSYEVVRVDAPVADDKLTRPDGIGMAKASGCGA